MQIEEVINKRKELEKVLKVILKETIDYGKLPKTDKRCLFKSGAEKLCEVYGYYKRFEIIDRKTNIEKDNIYFAYEIKAILYDKDTGQIVAEGMGSCNSKEKKYLKSNAYDVANTILKMAKKRAFVDRVLNATSSSDMFTQDLEEDNLVDNINDIQQNSNMNNNIQTNNTVENNEEQASSKQVEYIYKLLSQKGITVEQLRKELAKRYKIKESKLLSRKQASEFIKILQEYKEAV